jgi:hypothetical protein
VRLGLIGSAWIDSLAAECQTDGEFRRDVFDYVEAFHEMNVSGFVSFLVAEVPISRPPGSSSLGLRRIEHHQSMLACGRD